MALIKQKYKSEKTFQLLNSAFYRLNLNTKRAIRMIFIFLFQLLLACSVQGDLFRAAQIDRTVALALERSMEGLPFEDQLDDFFDAYYNNETEHMTEVLDHLKDEDITNEPDAMHRAMFIHDNLIKYVVNLCIPTFSELI